MKKFLKHIILYSLLLIAATAALFAFTVNRLNNDQYFRLRPAASNVFLGNSHVQYSIIDSMLPSSRNLGMKAETYVYTLIKARKIFPNNPEIKNAFIEVSNKQFNVYMDSLIWQDFYLKPRVPKFLSVMNSEEFSLLFSRNKSGTLSAVTDFPRQNLVGLSRNNADVMHRMEWGGYEPLPGNNIPRILRRIDSLGYNDDTIDNSLSPTNILYLEKLVQLCRDHHIRVWFFRAPAYAQSGYRRNEAIFQQILSTKFAGIPFLDFINLPFPENEYYDFDHLNPQGSVRFSKYLGELFKKNILETPGNRQQMITDYWNEWNQPAADSSAHVKN